MRRLFFLIRSLERGGAERQLIELVRGLRQDGFEVTVCTFYDGGALRKNLTEIPGVEVLSLGKQGRWDVVRFAWRLVSLLRSHRPDVIHSYLNVANELAILAGLLAGAKVVCGLRASNTDFSHYDAFSRYVFRLGALLSPLADGIIVNSEAGRRHHVEHGYSPDRMFVIHNGIDCDRFRPDDSARAEQRASWGIQNGETLLGLVARVDPKKDHLNFLEAASVVARRYPRARFVCVGEAPKSMKESLLKTTEALGLRDKLLWTGPRDEMQKVYNALDILVLSSAFGEGFPNVVGEAMATGRPCVVTDVGDSSLVVGSTGVVVPPKDSRALALGIQKLLDLPAAARDDLGKAARERIVANFSTHQLVETTKHRLLTIVDGERASGTASAG